MQTWSVYAQSRFKKLHAKIHTESRDRLVIRLITISPIFRCVFWSIRNNPHSHYMCIPMPLMTAPIPVQLYARVCMCSASCGANYMYSVSKEAAVRRLPTA